MPAQACNGVTFTFTLWRRVSPNDRIPPLDSVSKCLFNTFRATLPAPGECLPHQQPEHMSCCLTQETLSTEMLHDIKITSRYEILVSYVSGNLHCGFLGFKPCTRQHGCYLNNFYTVALFKYYS
jgi:hypothetical protein